MSLVEFEHFKEFQIVLFDATCVICDTWANFLIQVDRKAKFKLASVQSPLGQQLLAHFGYSTTDFDTMLFIDRGTAYDQSTAFLKIMQNLHLPWSAVQLGLITPKMLRDPLYRFVARNRYRWFGQQSCALPEAKHQQHFLENYLLLKTDLLLKNNLRPSVPATT